MSGGAWEKGDEFEASLSKMTSPIANPQQEEDKTVDDVTWEDIDDLEAKFLINTEGYSFTAVATTISFLFMKLEAAKSNHDADFWKRIEEHINIKRALPDDKVDAISLLFREQLR